MNDSLEQLISDHLDGTLSEAQRQALNALLRDSAEARETWRRNLELHARLHLDYAGEALPEAMPGTEPARPTGRSGGGRIGLAAAAMAILGLVLALLISGDGTVATLVSNENAAWESPLPTTPGSALSPGVMQLRTGVATIRFRSGAELILEAPAGLELKTAMRARLLSGSAAIEVPESAIGFVLETPDGYAVDHGTAFAVSVDPDSRRSSFEVLDGEISVHDPEGGQSLHLMGREAAAIQRNSVEKLSVLPSEATLRPSEESIRIGTAGRATTVLREGEGDPKDVHPDFLMTKLPVSGEKWERRSLLGFDVGEVDWNEVGSATLWLNLVPTGLGHAAHLEKENRFSIYGVTDPAEETWNLEVEWDQAPSPETALFLGSIEIPRSLQTGAFRLEGAPLLDFLRNDPDGSVTLIVVRDTPEVRQGGLVHAFASDSHPEASGPVLRLTTGRSSVEGE